MSDWKIHRKNNFDVLTVHPVDSETYLTVEKSFNGAVFLFNFIGHEYADHMERRHKEIELSVGIAGRNLEVLRGFLMEPVVNNLMSENNRLCDLLQHIKYHALNLSGDFPGNEESLFAKWVSEQITDKDAGW